jgi:hypothetical protein
MAVASARDRRLRTDEVQRGRRMISREVRCVAMQNRLGSIPLIRLKVQQIGPYSAGSI